MTINYSTEHVEDNMKEAAEKISSLLDDLLKDYNWKETVSDNDVNYRVLTDNVLYDGRWPRPVKNFLFGPKIRDTVLASDIVEAYGIESRKYSAPLHYNRISPEKYVDMIRKKIDEGKTVSISFESFRQDLSGIYSKESTK